MAVAVAGEASAAAPVAPRVPDGPATTAAPASAVPGDLVAAVVEALVPRRVILERTIHVWHYARRARMGLPEAGYLPPEDPRAAAFLASKVERYADRSVPLRPHGTVSGLWVGIDPVIGRTFGGVGEDWAVVQVELPPGFHYLDLRRPEGPARARQVLPEALTRALAAAGCPVRSAHALFTGLEHAACREVALSALDAMARQADAPPIDALLVEFPALRFRECSAARDGAFILLRRERVAPGRLKLMTRETSATDAAAVDRWRIRELYRRALAAGSERRPPWEELEAVSARPAHGADLPSPFRGESLDPWMAAHLLGCGDHPADRIPEFHPSAALAAREAR